MMQLQYRLFELAFKHPFGVSSNTRKSTTSVFISLSAKGEQGYGEACLPAYLGETPEATCRFFELARPLLQQLPVDLPLQETMQRVDQLALGHNAAKAAIDIALHDLAGKLAQQPCYTLLGLDKSAPRPTSFTIGIDAPEKLERKINEAAGFSILKIKAGTPDDRQLIAHIRRYTDKPLYVDVNQGWTNKHQVLEMIAWMKEQNVLLVEQPMPKTMKEEMRWVTERSPLPTIADESVKRLADLQELNGAFSGINMKLMKCTGLCEALQMISYCQKNNISILLGCMAESSCGTSAAAQLMGLADHVDLDAPLLYTNDPFTGMQYKSGKVVLNDLPGLGILPGNDLFHS